MKKSSFKTLFYLSNEDVNIVEIKRLDLPETADKSDIFHWLLFGNDCSIQKLTFVSMNEENGFQLREFKEGKLRFNDDIGFYDTETSHALQCNRPNELPDTLASLLENYLT
ncbi:hypothetical protein WH96_03040 [Kiloniella spongiae]|uniref:Uncharacterized protein n=1 Tax=Kiloniella spongiae TaxID=1489064 RepID=A0A0H2MJB5_9PROT|nr:hypothetical protein [Kiloniella spongiae]KLN62483.1 hypothetical protein WH96_03040 [Kiloniella spongiae]